MEYSTLEHGRQIVIERDDWNKGPTGGNSKATIPKDMMMTTRQSISTKVDSHMMAEHQIKSGCPNCSSGEIVEGKLLGHLDLGGGMVFRPKGRGLMGWLFRRDLGVNKPMFACSECGLLWSFVNTRPLRRMLRH